jgi:hypothetical protein
MTSAFIFRNKSIASIIALCVIVLAVNVLDMMLTRAAPNANTAANLQRKKDLADERVTCEKWGIRAGNENYNICIADLEDIRTKHDRRRANDLGNRGEGLILAY